MANFGWSYPAGCNSVPGDEATPGCPSCHQDLERFDEWDEEKCTANGIIYCSPPCAKRGPRNPQEEPQFLVFCRRTDDPKLTYIEGLLDQRGIVHRRSGYSFHAPILEVEATRIGEAWDVLETEVGIGEDGKPLLLDDIEDDDPMFQESLPPPSIGAYTVQNIYVAMASGLGCCSNCAQVLSTENIAAALRDYGIDPSHQATTETAAEIDKLTLCCPTYTDTGGCLGYSAEDKEKPAYWYSR